MLRTFFFAGIFSLLAGPVLQAQAPSASGQCVAFVVHKSSPLTNVSLDELRKIFLMEKTVGPDGQKFKVLMREPKQPERDAVLREIFRMSEAEYNRHFLQAVFTGAIQAAPKQIGSSGAVRSFVASTPGAIGYLRGDELDDTVKLVRVNGKTPGDADYPLKLAVK